MFARPRSLLVNQFASRITMAGRTAASTTPTPNRTMISQVAEYSRPCSEASAPHRISDQNTSRTALLRSA